MLRVVSTKPKCIIKSTRLEFNCLKYKDIVEYIPELCKYGAIKGVLGNPLSDQPVTTVWCSTDFGRCSPDNIPTSVKILILAMRAIKSNKDVCFYAGDVGDNYLQVLQRLCEESNNVTLYAENGILPQTQGGV